ncbi:serine/threonine-protein kinase [uncultured Duncaniella sp.]|uniref:serine/threonine protein kinase n=1 Tax=uncultured Duncaniella sp. TaxID=2768039 RepID=UPI002675A26F|nr:serine/threonine-protein kinase [uncultured Duncaniella sp.]MCI9172525.1 serine/threonine protein kinase [Muribaculaceae bacterium]
MQLNINSELQCGKYRILRVLGQGGFGITYLAEHTMLNKLIAIKEFFPKEYCNRDATSSHVTIGTQSSENLVAQLKNKFIKEARNISRLHHPNIIIIHDIFQENDTAYYVMEYVDGTSLSELVKQNGALSEATAISYIRKVADAVGYMHSLSMNHLDLKPANIMVRSQDNEPILIDFGLSKQYDASGEQTSATPIGISHGYAPIEQYRPGGVSIFSPQTDIYALGATLYNLLTGKIPPHYSEMLENGLPDFPSTISQGAIFAVKNAMQIKKVERPSDISKFLETLKVTATIRGGSLGKEYQLGFSHGDTEDTHIITNDRKVSDDTQLIQSSKFVDLGLSVLWGLEDPYMIPTIIGGERTVAYLYADEMIDLNNDLNISLPSRRDWLELIQKCKWSIEYVNQKAIRYKVLGPNGNYIFLLMAKYKTSSWIHDNNTKEYMLCSEYRRGIIDVVVPCSVSNQRLIKRK